MEAGEVVDALLSAAKVHAQLAGKAVEQGLNVQTAGLATSSANVAKTLCEAAAEIANLRKSSWGPAGPHGEA